MIYVFLIPTSIYFIFVHVLRLAHMGKSILVYIMIANVFLQGGPMTNDNGTLLSCIS